MSHFNRYSCPLVSKNVAIGTNEIQDKGVLDSDDGNLLLFIDNTSKTKWIDVTSIFDRVASNLSSDEIIAIESFDTSFGVNALVSGNPSMDTNVMPFNSLTYKKAIKNGLLRPLCLPHEDCDQYQWAVKHDTRNPKDKNDNQKKKINRQDVEKVVLSSSSSSLKEVVQNNSSMIATESLRYNNIDNTNDDDIAVIKIMLEVMDGLLMKSTEFLCGWNSRIVTLGSCIYLHDYNLLNISSPIFKLYVEGILIICEFASRLLKINEPSTEIEFHMNNRSLIQWSIEHGIRQRHLFYAEKSINKSGLVSSDDDNEDIGYPLQTDDPTLRSTYLNILEMSHLVLLPLSSYATSGALPNPQQFCKGLQVQIDHLQSIITTKEQSKSSMSSKNSSSYYLSLVYRLQYISHWIKCLDAITSFAEQDSTSIHSLMTSLIECHHYLALIYQTSPFFHSSSLKDSVSCYSTADFSSQTNDPIVAQTSFRPLSGYVPSPYFDDRLSRYMVVETPPINDRATEPKSFLQTIAILSRFVSSLFFLAPAAVAVHMVPTEKHLYNSLLLEATTTQASGLASPVPQLGLSWCGVSNLLSAICYLISCYSNRHMNSTIQSSTEYYGIIRAALWGALAEHQIGLTEEGLFSQARQAMQHMSAITTKHQMQNLLHQYSEEIPSTTDQNGFCCRTFIDFISAILIPQEPFQSFDRILSKVDNTTVMKNIFNKVFVQPQSAHEVVSFCFNAEDQEVPILASYSRLRESLANFWKAIGKAEALHLKILHVPGGQKFAKGCSDTSYVEVLRLKPPFGLQVVAKDLLVVIHRQLELAEQHLISTGCLETAILCDSHLADVLWMASILYLAHSVILQQLETTSKQSYIMSSQSLFIISLWYLFLHSNTKQSKIIYKTCMSCITSRQPSSIQTPSTYGDDYEYKQSQSHWNRIFNIFSTIPLPWLSLGDIIISMTHSSTLHQPLTSSMILHNIMRYVLSSSGHPYWLTCQLPTSSTQQLFTLYHCFNCRASNRSRTLITHTSLQQLEESSTTVPLFYQIFENCFQDLYQEPSNDPPRPPSSLLLVDLFYPYLDRVKSSATVSIKNTWTHSSFHWIPFWNIPFPVEWKVEL